MNARTFLGCLLAATLTFAATNSDARLFARWRAGGIHTVTYANGASRSVSCARNGLICAVRTRRPVRRAMGGFFRVITGRPLKGRAVSYRTHLSLNPGRYLPSDRIPVSMEIVSPVAAADKPVAIPVTDKIVAIPVTTEVEASPLVATPYQTKDKETGEVGAIFTSPPPAYGWAKVSNFATEDGTPPKVGTVLEDGGVVAYSAKVGYHAHYGGYTGGGSSGSYGASSGSAGASSGWAGYQTRTYYPASRVVTYSNPVYSESIPAYTSEAGSSACANGQCSRRGFRLFGRWR